MLYRILRIEASRSLDLVQLRKPYYTRDSKSLISEDFKGDKMSFVAAKKHIKQARDVFVYSKSAHYWLLANTNNSRKITENLNAFDNFLADCYLIFYDGELIGYVRFYTVANNKEISLSYGLLPKFIGRGLGTKLVENIKKFCKKEFSSRFNYISMYISMKNLPSLRVAKKNGFEIQNKTPVFSRGMPSFKLVAKI